jgi:hypothetical protein
VRERAEQEKGEGEEEEVTEGKRKSAPLEIASLAGQPPH